MKINMYVGNILVFMMILNVIDISMAMAENAHNMYAEQSELLIAKTETQGQKQSILMNKEYKSPTKAFLKAVWPGIIIHGSGTRYAGSSRRANLHLGLEIFCLSCPYILEGGALITIFGLPLNWITDIIEAPLTANRYNSPIYVDIDNIKKVRHRFSALFFTLSVFYYTQNELRGVYSTTSFSLLSFIMGISYLIPTEIESRYNKENKSMITPNIYLGVNPDNKYVCGYKYCF